MLRLSRGFVPLVICVLLALASYCLSLWAAWTKAPTMDEPLHFLAAYTRVFAADYRLDPEDPPLWCWLAMAPLNHDSLRVDLGESFDRLRRDPGTPMAVVDEELWFDRFENRSLAAIASSRAAMALLLPLLVLTCAWCAWRLAGSTAAVLAATLVALDPLLLGHAPLVKNDLAITFVTLLLVIALACTMQKLTWPCAIALVLLCAAAVTTKFSGLLLVSQAMLALLTRAPLLASWNVLGCELATRSRRTLAAAVITITCILVTWLGVWCIYGFRYSPTPDAGVKLDRDWFVRSYLASGGATNDAPLRLIEWADDHRLLPNSFLMGLLYTRGASLSREGFLMGERRTSGWWYYFPLGLAFKLPLTTIAVLLIAAITAARRRPFERTDGVSFLAAGVIAAGYFAVAMSSNLNIGVRHMMPLLPIAYVAAAVLITRVLSPRHGIVATALIAAALLLEVLPQWPDFLPFFNAASGGSRGGVRLLSDSNLDWGQDLLPLKRWQDAHPDVKLYLCYFGAVPPEAYGIRYTNLPGGHWTAPTHSPTTPGVLAVSATKLQGMYLSKGTENAYRPLLRRQPREIVGKTIYLYDYP